MGWISRKVVTCVYGTRDQWGHWTAVWQCYCLAGAPFAHGSAGSTVLLERKGISSRKGRTGAGFGGSTESGRSPRETRICSGIGTKGQRRKGRTINEIHRACRRG